MIKLEIGHMPLHSCFGIIDEIQLPKLVKTVYEIGIDEDIITDKFKVKLLHVYDSTIEILIFDNQGVTYKNCDDYTSNFNIKMIKNKMYELGVPLCDAMEWYEIKYCE